MPEVREESGVVFYFLGILSLNDHVIDIKLALADRINRCSESRNVFLEVGKGLCDVTGILVETFKLGSERDSIGDLIGLFTGDRNIIVNSLKETLALKAHGFHYVGIYFLDVVVSVRIGIGTCKYDKLSVDKVQPVHAV